MSKDNDIVTSVLCALAQSAMTPFEAAIEAVTDGKISSATADRLINGVVGDAVAENLLSRD